MKKIILAVTLLALGTSQMQTARAGGFPIAAGIAAGVVTGAVIADAVTRPPVYYTPAPSPAYYYPPAAYYQPGPAVVCAPAPVVYAPAPRVVLAPPVVTFGFGFGRTYWGGDYYGYRGHVIHRGRW